MIGCRVCREGRRASRWVWDNERGLRRSEQAGTVRAKRERELATEEDMAGEWLIQVQGLRAASFMVTRSQVEVLRWGREEGRWSQVD